MMWHAGDGIGWWMLWSGLMMVLFWGVIVATIVWTIQSATRRESTQTHAPHAGASARTALDIAKERYASGQIDREEFEEIKRGLGGQ